MRIPFFSAFLTASVLIGALSVVAVTHPDTPLPRAWNPTVPLKVSAPYSALTLWKASVAERSLATCLAALDTPSVVPLEPFRESDSCGIEDRVRIDGVGSAELAAVETDCAIALRLALWERHDLQTLARVTVGTTVSQIRHFSSYACRGIRTPEGEGRRMSLHAMGRAIDISGFGFSDGRTLAVSDDWKGDPIAQAFLRGAWKSACRWFGGVLCPDYNALHEDHFHLQVPGRGFCR
ncbi:hypothetical protein BOA8489_03146 [Boseongicola aestuarii]|uniref:Extensin-like C-terminal domain-containing protein n=1 Tax=Boseongicola aestuarii TaxID=1470561 RepID=A0A238J3U8_9RHOB|nr:hypothetical protein BOA8489_03146 [Boseongicola aestuarii]